MEKKCIILLLVFALGGAGCSDFLHLVPKNKTIIANYEDVKAELFAYLVSLTYSAGLSSPSYGTMTFRFPFYNDMAAKWCLYEDDLDMTHFTDHQDINDACKKAYTECIDWKGVSIASQLWNSCYGTIGFMNAILDDLEKVDGYTKEEYEVIAGEARIIRAYHIFKLLQFFAPYQDDRLGIPLNLDSENMTPSGRLTQSEIYRVIIKELEEVLTYQAGAEKWNIFYRHEIAEALLAQVYWFKAGSGAAEESDWENAEKHSATLIKYYVLEEQEETLKEIFAPDITEVTFLSPSYLVRFALNKAWSLGDIRTGCWAQGNAQHISQELLKLYGTEDIRLKAWFKEAENDNMQFYGVNKPAYTTIVNEVTVLFRTADFYLINAEAHFHLNHPDQAREMLEAFKRSRAAQGIDFSDQEILTEILNERRKEFCYETGTRWLDMKRLGVKTARIGLKKEGEGTTIYTLEPDDYRYTLPIPADVELDYNNIEQNPGWGYLN